MKFPTPKNLVQKVKRNSKETEENGKNKAKEEKVSTTASETPAGSVGERKLFGLFRIKSNKQLAIIGVVAAVILWLSITGIGIYGYKWENNYAFEVTKYVPYPMMTVNGNLVFYHPYLEQLRMLKNYQGEFKKVDFKSDEGVKILKQTKKDIIQRLKEDVIIKAEAKKLNIKLSQKELDDAYDLLKKSLGGEKTFNEVLDKYYKISALEYKEDIYKDRLLRQKVMEKFASDDSINQDSKKLADEVLKKVKAGENFSVLAKKYSQDKTATTGGDLGLIAKGKMLPELDAAAFTLKAGQTSKVVKTVLGFNILKVTEATGDKIHPYIILIKTKDFQTWLDESVQKASIHSLVKI